MGLIGKDNRKIYNGKEKVKSVSSWADQQGYKITFTHSMTGHSVEFPGSITSFQDSHASQQKLSYLYEEVDPVTRTQSTSRRRSFTILLSNGSLEEASHNEQNLNFLICMMYPKRDTNNQTVGQPLIRARGLGLISSRYNSKGIAVYVNQIVYSPLIESVFIVSKGTGWRGEDEIYPTQIEIRIDGDVRIDKYISDDGPPIPAGFPSYGA